MKMFKGYGYFYKAQYICQMPWLLLLHWLHVLCTQRIIKVFTLRTNTSVCYQETSELFKTGVWFVGRHVAANESHVGSIKMKQLMWMSISAPCSIFLVLFSCKHCICDTLDGGSAASRIQLMVTLICAQRYTGAYVKWRIVKKSLYFSNFILKL